MSENDTWVSSLESERHSLRIEKAELDKNIHAFRKEASSVAAKLGELDAKIKFAKENKDARVILTDHAMLRYIERKYNINIDELREEIMTPNVVAAVRMGEKSIETNGMKFMIDGTRIVTSLLPWMTTKREHTTKP